MKELIADDGERASFDSSYSTTEALGDTGDDLALRRTMPALNRRTSLLLSAVLTIVLFLTGLV